MIILVFSAVPSLDFLAPIRILSAQPSQSIYITPTYNIVTSWMMRLNSGWCDHHILHNSLTLWPLLMLVAIGWRVDTLRLHTVYLFSTTSMVGLTRGKLALTSFCRDALSCIVCRKLAVCWNRPSYGRKCLININMVICQRVIIFLRWIICL